MKTAIIGGGWAGCAAAVELAHAGNQVTLFEATRVLGGRARSVHLDGKVLDNGQHILLGAYTETQRLMRQVGIDPEATLLRLPLQMRYPPGTDGIDFIAPRLPAPFHLIGALIRAHGLDRHDKLALARFFSAARWMGWQLNNDCCVAELLQRFDQTPRLTELLWQPLCLAALNTRIERASSQVFLNVLHDSLAKRRAASDMLIPRVNLSALFPEQAAAFVQRCGGNMVCGKPVRNLQPCAAGWLVEGEHFDGVVVATQAKQAISLLNGMLDTRLLASFEYEPITTCYLNYNHHPQMAQPFFALRDDPGSSQWGQFVFDRGQLNPDESGLLAVVISDSSDAIATGRDALAAAVAAQLAEQLKQPELAQPEWVQVISERRATFACTPTLDRPQNQTNLPGLMIAGDYTSSPYPATLEAAVRSGINAARTLIGNR